MAAEKQAKERGITKTQFAANEVYITTSDCEHYLMSHILNRYGKKHGRWP